MYATNFVRINGFGYAFGGPEECGDGEHYDPDTDSCFTCDPGWVYSATGNTCVQSGGPGGGGGGGGTTPRPSTPPSSSPSTTKASLFGGGAMPWILGAVVVGAVVLAAKHHKTATARKH